MPDNIGDPGSLFAPLSIRGVTFRNRIVLPPMCQWLSNEEGLVQDYHLAHYGQRAIAGVGLIIVEATAVEDRGRISGRDMGLWADSQVPGMTRLAGMISQFGCVPGIQLGHAGCKAWKDGPQAIGPSPIAFSPKYSVPHQLSISEIDVVAANFVAAAKRAVDAGFKVLELHAAHGYLLHQFLSPLANQRTDEYGGSAANRLRLPLAIVREIRKQTPTDTIVTLRVSAVEYHPLGYSLDEMVEMCRAFKGAGADIIHVSSGGATPVAPPQWPGYQVEYARAIRTGAHVPVIGVGQLESPALAEFVLRTGYCDMVAVGREMLRNPNWPSTAALALGAQVPVVEALKPVFQPAPR